MADDASDHPTGDDGSSALFSGRLRQSLLSLFGMRGNVGSARAEIEDALALDEASGAAFSPEERAMLRAILKFGGMRVEDVMVPRADMEAVEVGASLAGLLARFREAGHTRMPVYRDTLDDPLGMVHLKDVTSWMLDAASGGIPEDPADGPRLNETRPNETRAVGFDLSRIDLGVTLVEAGMMRPLLFVPPSMPARALLNQMRAQRIQMAVVIDEYGGVEGLVSIEDLVELIVGEIEDEHDEEAVALVRGPDGSLIADARTELSDLVREIGLVVPSSVPGDVDTLGGLIFSTLGRVPTRGEIVSAIEGYEIEVLDADARRVRRVRLRDSRQKGATPFERTRTGAADARGPADRSTLADTNDQAAIRPTGAAP